MQDLMPSDQLCYHSPQKDKWKGVNVHCYFFVRKHLPLFDLNRHFWVSHKLICETCIWIYQLIAPFSATQLWVPYAAEIFGLVPPVAICRLQRTKSSCSPGFPRWNARCSSWSLIQPAGFLLPPSGHAVSGWMPTALAHPPEVNKWDQCFRAPQGQLRRPVTGTHHCLWLIHQGRVREIYEWAPYASPTSASS